MTRFNLSAITLASLAVLAGCGPVPQREAIVPTNISGEERWAEHDGQPPEQAEVPTATPTAAPPAPESAPAAASGKTTTDEETSGATPGENGPGAATGEAAP